MWYDEANVKPLLMKEEMKVFKMMSVMTMAMRSEFKYILTPSHENNLHIVPSQVFINSPGHDN